MANHLTPSGPEHESLRRPATRSADAPVADPGAAPVHPMLSLQRAVGNAAIQRLLAQREAPEEEEPIQASRDPGAVQRQGLPDEDELQMSRDTVQREAEDEEELQMSRDSVQREADEEELQMSRDTVQREAEDEELQMSRDTVQREAEEEELQMSRDDVQREEDEEELQMSRDADVQREAVEEEEPIQMARDGAVQREGPEEELQMSRAPLVGPEGGTLDDGTAGRIQAKRGAGSTLDDGTRSAMEERFGTSFEDVRVHTDTESDKLNRDLGARAFTTGSDIFFRGDAAPSNAELLSHELTHVVQQRDMPSSGGGMKVGPAGDAYEAAAESTAATVSTGGAVAQPQRDDA